MKRILGILVFLSVAMLAAYAKNTKPIHLKLELASIVAHKTMRTHGDAVYVTTASLYAKRKNEYLRVPEYPLSWPSKHLEKVKDVPVWEGELANDESVSLVFTVIEQNVPPWWTDDLIGSVRVHLKNEKGKLVAKWSMPNMATPKLKTIPKSNDKRIEAVLTGDENCQYNVVLNLTDK